MEIPDIAWVAVALVIVVLFFVIPSLNPRLVEKFFADPTAAGSAAVDTRDADVAKFITKIYQDILDRYPSDTEMNEHRRAILRGKRTFDDVRQRLIDSVEFKKKMKMQSNTLVPELPKMISDSKILRRLAQIYLEERKKTIPGKMVLPIKDIFTRLDYNEKALRYMLRSEKWSDFEDDIMLADNFSEAALDDLIAKYFGSPEKIIEDAEKAEPDSSDPNEKVDRMIADEDSDMSGLLDDLNENAYKIFDKDKAALCTCGANAGTGDCVVHKEVAIKPHYGDMVLRPEFAWSVPQQRPPVCTTLGKPALVQPIYLDSSLSMNGTLLGEAQDTGVGSIMPKFRYKEYAELDMKEKCTSSKPTTSTEST